MLCYLGVLPVYLALFNLVICSFSFSIMRNFILLFLFLVHRIGRTGRSGRTGIATTFINKANDESVLLDLKHLLMEAKQKVPPFLAELQSENEKYLDLGGKFYDFL